MAGAAPNFNPPPLTGGKLVLGTIALSLATFMNVLDSSIANVSIPAIAGDFGVSPTQGTWVITSFAVSNAISVPLTGWLTQRFGMVRLFTLSILLFVVASLLCGLAPNFGFLVAFRALQGLVAGPMIPLSQSLLLQSYPASKSGLALSFWSMTTLVAPVMGPVLGGAITDNYSWPWIFYINVPVGLVAIAITWLLYRDRESPTRKLPIDAIGLVSLVIWVGALQIMLDNGKELDWFASTTIIVLALVAAVTFVFFLIWEVGEEHPIVDLQLFTRRNFWIGTTTISLAYGIFFGNIVLLPLWLQEFMGYTATWAGLLMAPVGLLAIVLTPIVGANLHRVDLRLLATVALLSFALTFWMRSHFNTQADLYTLVLPSIVQGIPMAFFFVPLMALVLSGLPPERIPSATGLSNFVRITAGAFGTSIYTTLWEDRAALHHARLTESIHAARIPVDDALSLFSSAGLSREQGLESINRLIEHQAYMLSANDLFAASALLCLLLTSIVWFARKTYAGAPADTGGAH
ncbi:MAG: DHA2 family efflux MFS transporter permease subunit [Pseudomonadales bacterium]|jgi:DHA2 family multidrug resistance protein|nr:DHA2 family efflux MFS transporter permease subunit [Pseudomonadales bacterium]MCP5319850.1 DHA2 family efflux MFS transporter permease subunit [Pseudomonadales bacterium]MCP5337892.1 DHA2 family efflux MFS transporter permease subunit [Pseudomonadales bacterium]